MDISILKSATRDNKGIRRWKVAGFSNGAKYLPSSQSMWKTPAVYWPARDERGEMVRGARLDLHKSVIKSEIKAMMLACSD